MSDYTRTILRDFSVALHIPAIMAVVSILVCFLSGDTFIIPGFAACATISFIFGQLLFRRFRGAAKMRLRHAMNTALLAWISISLIGVLPFLVTAYWPSPEFAATDAMRVFRDPWNALFESVSGFTSTGLSVTRAPEALPDALQWWRSFMQWIGGVGILVLMLSVFHPSGDAERLYLAEGRDRTVVPGIEQTVRTIWWIYCLFTVLAMVVLKVTGMSWWHALNYGMTGIATGGFGATNGNIGDFGTATRLVLLAIILIGAMSFESHHKLLVKRQFSVLWTDRQNRLFLVLLPVGAGLLIAEIWWSTGDTRWFDGVFHWFSALCTAGFQSSTFDDWGPTAQILLAIGMMMGGIAGSTAGGLKLYRVSIIGRGAVRRIRTLARQPWRLSEHDSLADRDEEAQRQRRALEAASIIAVMWVLTLVMGTVILLHFVSPGTASEAVLLEAASALGNVGLSSGIAGPDLPWGGKLTLIVLMLAGRLEIVPVLVFIANFRRRGSGASGDGRKT